MKSNDKNGRSGVDEVIAVANAVIQMRLRYARTVRRGLLSLKRHSASSSSGTLTSRVPEPAKRKELQLDQRIAADEILMVGKKPGQSYRRPAA